jgi:quinohemoprotein ethanol dehydrogenase
MRALIAAVALTLAACSGGGADDLPAGYGAGDDWDNPGGDWASSHFSRLTDISADNIGELGLAWEYDLGTSRVQESTPVVIDGVMYASGNLGRVYALNAATGEELWTFTPEVQMQANRAACCDQANRGLQVHQGKVFVASLDGWLYAIDARTGEPVWEADTIADKSRGYTITGAPEIAGDLVLIGNAGAEFDARGYVTAYKVSDGSEAWRFYTVPRDPAEGPQENPELEAALATWSKDTRWDIGGGGTVWDAINYDPKFDQVIIGTGNGGPYPMALRSPGGGDNLYLNSLVALDRKTGRVNWHFQETPQDQWDLTATQPMILAELDGRPVVLHTPKNGFFFVVDRETGKPIAANPIVRTTWADKFDLESGQFNLLPEASDYTDGPKIVFPASAGARNWYPAAYDPSRGLYFAHVIDMGNLIWLPPGPPRPERQEGFLNAGAAMIFSSDLEQAVEALPPPLRDQVKALPEFEQVRKLPQSNELRAIDPLTGETKWKIEGDGYQDRHGVLATASGLVFFGDLAGKLHAADSDSGEIVWSADTGSSIMAAPMTYRVGGVQYVAVQTGFGGGGWGFVPPYSAAYKRGNANRLLVFKIGGGEVPLPPELPPLQPAPEPPAQLPGVTPAMIAEGQALLTANCSICHSNQPRAGLPDLRRMAENTHAGFEAIVLEGALVPGGMPRWDDRLSPAQVKAIHAYLIHTQGKLRAVELELQRQGKALDSPSAAIMSNF